MGQRDMGMTVSQTSRGSLNQQRGLILEHRVILREILGKEKIARWYMRKAGSRNIKALSAHHTVPWKTSKSSQGAF